MRHWLSIPSRLPDTGGERRTREWAVLHSIKMRCRAGMERRILPNMSTLTTTELLNIPHDLENQAKMDIAMAQMQAASATPDARFINFAAFGTAAGMADTDTAFRDGLAHPEVKRKADEDINQLADNIRSVKASFQQIGSQLANVDALSMFWFLGGSPVHLSVKWGDIRKVCHTWQYRLMS